MGLKKPDTTSKQNSPGCCCSHFSGQTMLLAVRFVNRSILQRKCNLNIGHLFFKCSEMCQRFGFLPSKYVLFFSEVMLRIKQLKVAFSAECSQKR